MSKITLRDAPRGIGRRPEERRTWPKAEKYLGQVKEKLKEIEKLNQRKENLLLLQSDKAIHLTGMPRGDSPDLQREQTRTVEIDELKEKIEEAESELKALKEEIGDMIMATVSDPDGQAVLIWYYIHRLSWREVGLKRGFCKTQILRIRDDSMDELEEGLPDEEK